MREPRLAQLLGLAAGVFLLHLLQWELLPFALAAILAFLSDPPIRAARRRFGGPRWPWALLAFLLIMLFLSVLSGVSLAEAAVAGMHLAARGPQPLQAALTKVLGPNGVQLFGARLTAQSVIAALSGAASGLLTAKGFLGVTRPVLAILVGGVLFVFATLSALLSGPSLARGAHQLLPDRARARTAALLPGVLKVLRRYFTGILVIVVVTTVCAGLGYGLVFHVRRPIVLALALGVLETVPVIGPLLSAGLVLLSALQLHNLTALILMIGYAMLLRVLIDDVVAPFVLGRSVEVPPLLVMFSYVVGAALFGVVGLLFAVPALAVARIVIEERRSEAPSS